jgi:hypothetical protein
MQAEESASARDRKTDINPCGCGAQPHVRCIKQRRFKFKAFCPVTWEKCHDWIVHLGVTREEAIRSWNEAHPIENGKDDGYAPG